MNTRVRTICAVAMATVLLMLSAWIAVPTVPPFTLQTAAIYLIGALLGWRKGAAAIVLYWLLGLIGVPVFAGFTGGAAVLFGPTGGYLVGFLPMVMLAAVRMDASWKRLACWVVGLLICYAVGTVWYAAVYLTCSIPSLVTAAATCVVPYILPDIAKTAAAWSICRRVESRIQEYL